MAAISIGRPVVTTAGPLTEALWAESKAVALVPVGRLETLRAAAEGLLTDPIARAQLGAAARRLYEDQFAVERTVETLRRFAAEPDPMRGAW
jgi:hypothetical protein